MALPPPPFDPCCPDPPWSLDIRVLTVPDADDEEIFLVLDWKEPEIFLLATLLLTVDELPEIGFTGADVFLLTETVSGRLSRLPPKTLISLLGADALRVDALTAVLTLVGLTGPDRIDRTGLLDVDTGVPGARSDDFPAVSL